MLVPNGRVRIQGSSYSAVVAGGDHVFFLQFGPLATNWVERKYNYSK